MAIFKSKSLTKDLTDEETKKVGFSTRFISFESAIRLFQEELNVKETPVGYRVTEQGIEMLYKN